MARFGGMVLSNIERLLLVLGLAMDGFAAAVCMGLSMKEHKGERVLRAVGLVTGFHMTLFAAGHLFGAHCARWMEGLCRWLPGLLLLALGLQMLLEAGRGKEMEAPEEGFSFLPLAFSTSIDAATVGLSFAMLDQALLPSLALVALVMGLLAVLGVCFGRLLGRGLRRWAVGAGGLILWALGVKNLWGFWLG